VFATAPHGQAKKLLLPKVLFKSGLAVGSFHPKLLAMKSGYGPLSAGLAQFSCRKCAANCFKTI
jgi:hypothetical protein